MRPKIFSEYWKIYWQNNNGTYCVYKYFDGGKDRKGILQMKKEKISVLEILAFVLALGLVFFVSCVTDTGNGEPYDGPKTIKITGFNEEGLTPNGGYVFYTDALEWPPVAVGQSNDTFKLTGQTITVELIDWGIFFTDLTTEEPWTGTCKYFIVIQGKPPKNDSSKDGSNYAYSADGINPTSVDINFAKTTLE
jgi:hypothetical protein